ncbi:hypothetical protein [Salinibacterium sp.]|uniref:hypothetical protein n=1 Tax=Salinibacterium sp. TaxID=1915057 RepID=UPI00286B9C10|nr:hypothetical protein [Salinibacterium sp.]
MTAAAKLRPHSHLFGRGLTACLVFMTPVFLVLYFLTVPVGPWRAVLVAQIVATLIIGFASFRLLAAAIWVDPTGIAERGFFRSKKYIPLSAIGSIVMADRFEPSRPAGVPQLYVCDHDGKQLIRMRGQFWSRASMEIVAATLDVPFVPVEDALSTREINEEFPGLGYWFERRPVLAALVFSIAIAAVGLLSFALLRLAGVPVGA